MECKRCGKWAGAHATLPGQSRDHLCMCQRQDDTEINAAKKRLKQIVPYLRSAVKEAGEKGVVEFGILSVNPDGSGQIKAKFDGGSFIEDVALVVGAKPHTEQDDMASDVLAFLNKHGL